MSEISRTERALVQATSAWLERLVGGLALALTLLLGSFVLVLARSLLSPPGATTLGVLVLLAFSLGLAAFFLVAGFRLAFQVPNASGSLFAPWVWFSISGLAGVLALAIAYFGLRDATIDAGQGFISALLLALFSYGAGSRFQRKAQRRNGAA